MKKVSKIVTALSILWIVNLSLYAQDDDGDEIQVKLEEPELEEPFIDNSQERQERKKESTRLKLQLYSVNEQLNVLTEQLESKMSDLKLSTNQLRAHERVVKDSNTSDQVKTLKRINQRAARKLRNKIQTYKAEIADLESNIDLLQIERTDLGEQLMKLEDPFLAIRALEMKLEYYRLQTRQLEDRVRRVTEENEHLQWEVEFAQEQWRDDLQRLAPQNLVPAEEASEVDIEECDEPCGSGEPRTLAEVRARNRHGLLGTRTFSDRDDSETDTAIPSPKRRRSARE